MGLINDKSWQKEVVAYFDVVKGEFTDHYDLTDVYYQTIEDRLADYDFTDIKIHYMEIIGETVVRLDDRFMGYLQQWLEDD